MNIIQAPSSNFKERPSGIDAIIIHYTDMVSVEAALAWLTNPASQVSAHYLIDWGGQIYQMVDEEQRAWHAGESYWQGRTNLNDCSIGIELANPGHGNGYTPFPDVQIDSLIKLCLDIKERWSIPASRILGHSDIAPQRKQDPGHLFPWKQLAAEGLGMWPIPFPVSVIPAKAGPQGVSDIKSPGSRTLRKPRLSLRFSKFQDDALWISMLSQIGYDITSPSHALTAFQRHFQPHKVDGIADEETYALLQDLLKSQKMLIQKKQMVGEML